MKDAIDIKKLRCSKGYFSQRSMVQALKEKGIRTSPQTYSKRESGKTPFTVREIKALTEILGLTAEEGLEFFS